MFETEFTNNGNSFDTCFQFTEEPREDRLYKRVKIYNKLLAFFQSKNVKKPLGMNT